MRDPARTDRMIELLRQAWRSNPDLQLRQLVCRSDLKRIVLHVEDLARQERLARDVTDELPESEIRIPVASRPATRGRVTRGSAMIERIGNQYILYSRRGVALGVHRTRREAEAQETAIQISKARAARHDILAARGSETRGTKRTKATGSAQGRARTARTAR